MVKMVQATDQFDQIIPLFADRVHSPGAYEPVDYRETDERTIKRFAQSLGLLDE